MPEPIEGRAQRRCLSAELTGNTGINREIFRLEFAWHGPAPRAGQFFMIRPRRGSVLLGRPISAAGWGAGKDGSKTLRFLIARRGKGTAELGELRLGEEAELTGPLGNAWTDFLPGAGEKPIALIGGGIGTAPLLALPAEEPPGVSFDFYAGFRTAFKTGEERYALLGPAALLPPGRLTLAFEDPAAPLDSPHDRRGRIPGFLDPAPYAAVFACGPEPMLKAVADKCRAAGTPCYISLERRMACGAGACLGCTVRTIAGNKRCCADGPIFPAGELIFDA
jgi:NAD(P)H-flavin reductase